MNYLELELLVTTRIQTLHAEAERRRLLAECRGERGGLREVVGLATHRAGLWLAARGAALAGERRAETPRPADRLLAGRACAGQPQGCDSSSSAAEVAHPGRGPRTAIQPS